MGQRHRAHAFMPEAYVFPGGTVDRADGRITPATALRPDVAARLARHSNPTRARALGIAAVRETYEETGLMLAKPAPPPNSDVPAVWRGFLDQGLAPALDELEVFLRAITPTDSPIRFHARFFLADGGKLRGKIGGSGELENIGWFGVNEAFALSLSDITEFVLQQATGLMNRPRARVSARRIPLASYRNREYFTIRP